MNQNSIHWFIVVCWILFHDFLHIKQPWSFWLYIFSNFVYDFLSCLARSAGGPWLDGQNWLKKSQCSVLSSRNFSVVMQSKCLRVWVMRQVRNVCDIVSQLSEVRCIVYATFAKFVFILKHIRCYVFFKDGLN